MRQRTLSRGGVYCINHIIGVCSFAVVEEQRPTLKKGFYEHFFQAKRREAKKRISQMFTECMIYTRYEGAARDDGKSPPSVINHGAYQPNQNQMDLQV